MNLFVFILGTVIGSFVNVCIYRLPRGESPVYPSSHCPQCGYYLGPLDLVPIFSYFWLGGRCQRCRHKISLRYPLVEFLTGFFFLLAFIKWGFTYEFLTAVILISSLIISTFVDIEYGIIPDIVTFPTMVVGFLLHLSLGFQHLPDYFMGFVLGGGVILIIVVISRGGMGGGDIKLFAMVGMLLGLRLTVLSLLLSFISGSIVGIILIVLKLKGMKDSVPFGPFIALGSVISLFTGDKIISWYMTSFF